MPSPQQDAAYGRVKKDMPSIRLGAHPHAHAILTAGSIKGVSGVAPPAAAALLAAGCWGLLLPAQEYPGGGRA